MFISPYAMDKFGLTEANRITRFCRSSRILFSTEVSGDIHACQMFVCVCYAKFGEEFMLSRLTFHMSQWPSSLTWDTCLIISVAGVTVVG